jgi:hypothetical protein
MIKVQPHGGESFGLIHSAIKAFRTRATRDPAARLTAPMKLAAFKNPLHKKIST